MSSKTALCNRHARITINTTNQTRQAIAEMLIQMGFQFGENSPAWGKFLEAIERGDIIIYQKIN